MNINYLKVKQVGTGEWAIFRLNDEGKALNLHYKRFFKTEESGQKFLNNTKN